MYLGTVDILVDATNGGSAIAVASETTTVYTAKFPTHGADAFGLEFIATTATGTPDVLVKFEASFDGTNSVVPEGLAPVINLTDEIRHIKQLSIPPCMYGRLNLIGQNDNAAGVTVTTKLFRQEQQ